MNCPRCGEELDEAMGSDFNMVSCAVVPHVFWYCKCGFRSDVANL